MYAWSSTPCKAVFLSACACGGLCVNVRTRASVWVGVWRAFVSVCVFVHVCVHVCVHVRAFLRVCARTGVCVCALQRWCVTVCCCAPQMERQMSMGSSMMSMQGPAHSTSCSSTHVPSMHSEAKLVSPHTHTHTHSHTHSHSPTG